jgi:hypothetical protein
MGGIGSGRRYQGGKDITDDYRALDVRHWKREGLLAPGHFFTTNWIRNGETVSSIQVRTEAAAGVESVSQNRHAMVTASHLTH